MNDKEPKFPDDGVVCPDWLRAEAKAEWARVAPLLETQGLLTEADRAQLVAYCTAWAEFRDAEEKLQQFGSVVKQGPQVIPSPYVSIKNKAVLTMTRIGQNFGFSPASRTQIHVPNTQKNELDLWREQKHRHELS